MNPKLVCQDLLSQPRLKTSSTLENTVRKYKISTSDQKLKRSDKNLLLAI